MQRKSKNYLYKIKRIVKRIKSKDIEDIFLFGSAVTGKYKPNDFDICIVFKEKVNRIILHDLNSEFENNKLNVHISSLTIDNFFKKSHSLVSTILREGISLLTNKPFASNFALKSHVMYSYDLTNLKKSNKVRFVYVLKGRNKEQGVVKEFKGKFIQPGIFILPNKFDKEMLDIFKIWKVKFSRKPIMLMN
tara:strand:+ start:3370 stop:3942 length:573 start_codon:yes stop_codon:yes gene_type:complete